jgi:hypothetical protein
MDLAFRATCIDAQARVKELTPVDTGRLRASWYLEPPAGQIKAGQVVTIGTNVEYARAVEFGVVTTTKTGRLVERKGRGMVAQTVRELPDIARRAVARVTGRGG